MSKRLWKKEQMVTAKYHQRCEDREITMMTATMNLVAYFILNDSSQDDDDTKKANAEAKVGLLSNEVAAHLYPYRLGNVQPLIDAVGATSLVFMTQDAKDYIINDLTI